MYEKILVGTDGSSTAAEAVARAVDVAKATGARLTILTAGRAQTAQRVVDEAAARHADAGVEIDTVVDGRDAASALVEVADAGDYDLLVVGNRGMTGASRFVLGSVPNKVSHHIGRSILIVRTT
ncbi:MAG: Universal stress protein [Acidimicrobiales bacterium]|nr:Universal stress protein [Acidimicrobiales bacterium]